MICRERIVCSPNVSYHSVPMQIQGLARAYRTKTDEELLQLAMSSEQLTPEAHAILTSELATRGIDLNEHLKERENAGSALIERRAPRSIPFFRDSHTVGAFLRLAMLLFFLFLVAEAASALLSSGIFLGIAPAATSPRRSHHSARRSCVRGLDAIGLIPLWARDTGAYLGQL